MHQEVFKTVPSLPLFVVDSQRRLEMNPSSDSPRTYLTSASEYTLNSSGVTESEYPRPPQRRRHKSKSKSSPSERRQSGSEILVHGAKQRRSSHKSSRRHKSYTEDRSDQENKAVLNMEESSLNESQSPRSVLQSNGRKSLSREAERAENSESTKRTQLSEFSQDSGYQPPGPERTMSKEAYIKDLLMQLTEFEHEYRNVEKQRNDFQNQLSLLKKQKAQADADIEKMAKIQSENKNLNEDVLMLKNLVYRLNHELEKYQERLHKYEDKPLVKLSRSDAVHMPENGVTLNQDTLGPLLEAYDETIREKDDLLQNYEKELNVFVNKCKEVVLENENLHQDLEEATQKKEATTSQFDVLHHDASLAREQNDLLVQQVQVQKEKLAEVHGACQEKVTEFAKKNDELLENFHRTRGDLLTLQGSYSVLREEYDKLKKESENKVPFCVHSAAVAECRRLFDELKLKYETDKAFLSHRVEDLSSENPQLESQIITLKAEVNRLEIHTQTMDKLLKKTQQKCEENQKRWVTTKISKDAIKRQLQKAIAFAEELIQEQEKLVKQLHEKQEENNSMYKIGSSLVNRMGSLKSKLKDVQKGAWQELDTIEKRIARQESGVGKMKEEYQREMERLKGLVKQKEAIILRLQQEKSKTEEDLEVVWKAATYEDRKLKESFSRQAFNVVPENVAYSEDKF